MVIPLFPIGFDPSPYLCLLFLIFWNVHDGPHLSQIEMHKSSPPLVGCMGDLLGWWMLNRSILGIGFVDLATRFEFLRLRRDDKKLCSIPWNGSTSCFPKFQILWFV